MAVMIISSETFVGQELLLMINDHMNRFGIAWHWPKIWSIDLMVSHMA